VVNDAVNRRVFDGRFDRAHAVEVFVRHVADVRAAVPPERLLVFEVAQGWEPLCGFLNVPVPDEPFPHANDAGEFRRWRARTAARALGPPLVVAALAVAAAVVVGRRLSR
jgi:hypothetical protein